LGPFIKTKDDNLYVVTVTDGYSKYSVIKAGPSVEAGPTITFLKEFISNYGRPERIISDRRTAYTSEAFENFCRELNIQHVKVATATPRANGQIVK
jgi:transposase InsO family protein